MALIVVRPGANTTVQDRGRVGYRGFGVPVGGAFDRASFDLANALLGNDPAAAALEMTLVGGSYRAEIPLPIALAGAPMSAEIRSATGSDRRLDIPQTATLQPGDELIIGGCPFGARTYLSVQGGWQTPMILGSRSTETRLQAGEILLAEPGSTSRRRPSVWPWAVTEKNEPIRIVDGPDAGPGDARLLEQSNFQLSAQSDRMGLRFEGPTIDREAAPDRPSAPVAPGTIQITGGQPIVLGVAGGTMGGYFHLAQILTTDLDRLAQRRPGDLITFCRVEIDEARRMDRLDRLDRARFFKGLRTWD